MKPEDTMSVGVLLARALDQGNTLYTQDGSVEYDNRRAALIKAIDPTATSWDEVYDGDEIIGYDIDGIRITMRED